MPKKILAVILCILTIISMTAAFAEGFDYSLIPEYSGYPYVEVNGNIPYFTKEEIETYGLRSDYEVYSPLDDLGRCGPAIATVCIDIMPTTKREAIGSVKPTGWQTITYPEYIADKYLYNRCHLIAFMLAGENANPLNLITGTRNMNVVGMLPFEDEVNDYVQFTDNHVLYRVTPVFVDDELVARGVLMEARDIENNGNSVQFCVFCYNVQPYIEIDYRTGESRIADKSFENEGTGWTEDAVKETYEKHYILNTNSKTFHNPECSAASKISKKNRQEVNSDRELLIKSGYKPCRLCHP